MNKKVDEEFKYIHDEYMLQCTCTEMKDKINNLQSKIDKVIEYIEKSMNNPQPFHEYLFGDEDGKVENLDKLLDILKEDK